ncbi:hypothetical protein Tco_0521787 [Tanacetum coccineum]
MDPNSSSRHPQSRSVVLKKKMINHNDNGRLVVVVSLWRLDEDGGVMVREMAGNGGPGMGKDEFTLVGKKLKNSTFKYELSQNMNNLEKELNNEILHKKYSKSALSVIKVQFDKFIHSEILKSSNYDSNAREARQDFKDYTQMEAQSFKDLIIQHMESIEQCIVERARHEQEIQNRLKRLNERKLQIQECMIQKVKASNASSGEKDCSRIISDKGNDQGL